MSEAKHTPGPWTIEAVYIGRERVNFGEYRFPHQPAPNCKGHSREYPDEEAEANARLIAAAPELLAALKRVMELIAEGVLVRDISGDGSAQWPMKMLDLCKDLNQIRGAIAKAEGRS